MIFCPGDPASQSTNQMDPAKKKTIEELVKKHKGEEAERQTLLSLDELFHRQVGTLILGQKSNLNLIEQSINFIRFGNEAVQYKVVKLITLNLINSTVGLT